MIGKNCFIGCNSIILKGTVELIERKIMEPLDPTKGLPRIDGLYAVEDALYRTDKHTADRIDALCVALMKNGVHIEGKILTDLYGLQLPTSLFAPDLMRRIRMLS